ncbi:MAG: hypothetical protein JW855_05945 [Gammaproteobacteria bacterium]|nr:hypothetical protein [Gammaproteobacteria bacterium]
MLILSECLKDKIVSLFESNLTLEKANLRLELVGGNQYSLWSGSGDSEVPLSDFTLFYFALISGGEREDIRGLFQKNADLSFSSMTEIMQALVRSGEDYYLPEGTLVNLIEILHQNIVILDEPKSSKGGLLGKFTRKKREVNYNDEGLNKHILTFLDVYLDIMIPRWGDFKDDSDLIRGIQLFQIFDQLIPDNMKSQLNVYQKSLLGDGKYAMFKTNWQSRRATKGSFFVDPLSDETFTFKVNKKKWRDLLIQVSDPENVRSLVAAVDTGGTKFYKLLFDVKLSTAQQIQCLEVLVNYGESLSSYLPYEHETLIHFLYALMQVPCVDVDEISKKKLLRLFSIKEKLFLWRDRITRIDLFKELSEVFGAIDDLFEQRTGQLRQKLNLKQYFEEKLNATEIIDPSKEIDNLKCYAALLIRIKQFISTPIFQDEELFVFYQDFEYRNLTLTQDNYEVIHDVLLSLGFEIDGTELYRLQERAQIEIILDGEDQTAVDELPIFCQYALLMRSAFDVFDSDREKAIANYENAQRLKGQLSDEQQILVDYMLKRSKKVLSDQDRLRLEVFPCITIPNIDAKPQKKTLANKTATAFYTIYASFYLNQVAKSYREGKPLQNCQKAYQAYLTSFDQIPEDQKTIAFEVMMLESNIVHEMDLFKIDMIYHISQYLKYCDNKKPWIKEAYEPGEDEYVSKQLLYGLREINPIFDDDLSEGQPGKIDLREYYTNILSYVYYIIEAQKFLKQDKEKSYEYYKRSREFRARIHPAVQGVIEDFLSGKDFLSGGRVIIQDLDILLEYELRYFIENGCIDNIPTSRLAKPKQYARLLNQFKLFVETLTDQDKFYEENALLKTYNAIRNFDLNGETRNLVERLSKFDRFSDFILKIDQYRDLQVFSVSLNSREIGCQLSDQLQNYIRQLNRITQALANNDLTEAFAGFLQVKKMELSLAGSDKILIDQVKYLTAFSESQNRLAGVITLNIWFQGVLEKLASDEAFDISAFLNDHTEKEKKIFYRMYLNHLNQQKRFIDIPLVLSNLSLEDFNIEEIEAIFTINEYKENRNLENEFIARSILYWGGEATDDDVFLRKHDPDGNWNGVFYSVGLCILSSVLEATYQDNRLFEVYRNFHRKRDLITDDNEILPSWNLSIDSSLRNDLEIRRVIQGSRRETDSITLLWLGLQQIKTNGIISVARFLYKQIYNSGEESLNPDQLSKLEKVFEIAIHLKTKGIIDNDLPENINELKNILEKMVEYNKLMQKSHNERDLSLLERYEAFAQAQAINEKHLKSSMPKGENDNFVQLYQYEKREIQFSDVSPRWFKIIHLLENIIRKISITRQNFWINLLAEQVCEIKDNDFRVFRLFVDRFKSEIGSELGIINQEDLSDLKKQYPLIIQFEQRDSVSIWDATKEDWNTASKTLQVEFQDERLSSKYGESYNTHYMHHYVAHCAEQYVKVFSITDDDKIQYKTKLTSLITSNLSFIALRSTTSSGQDPLLIYFQTIIRLKQILTSEGFVNLNEIRTLYQTLRKIEQSYIQGMRPKDKKMIVAILKDAFQERQFKSGPRALNQDGFAIFTDEERGLYTSFFEEDSKIKRTHDTELRAIIKRDVIYRYEDYLSAIGRKAKQLSKSIDRIDQDKVRVLQAYETALRDNVLSVVNAENYEPEGISSEGKIEILEYYHAWRENLIHKTDQAKEIFLEDADQHEKLNRSKSWLIKIFHIFNVKKWFTSKSSTMFWQDSALTLVKSALKMIDESIKQDIRDMQFFGGAKERRDFLGGPLAIRYTS